MAHDRMEENRSTTGTLQPPPLPLLPLWRNRDFMLLRCSQAISVAGSRASGIAVPLLVLALTHSPLQAGMVGFFGAVPSFLFNLPAGALVDRWNRKRTMIVCDTGRAMAVGSVVIALHLGRLSVVQLCMAAFVEGTLSTFFGLSEIAALPRIVPQEQLSLAISRNEAIRSGAHMTGPSLGGILCSVSRSAPFLVDTISYAVSILSLQLIRTEFQGERAPQARNLRAEIRAGLSWIWNWPFMRISLFFISGTNLLFTANWLAVIVLAKQLHASPAVIGVIYSLLGVGSLLGSAIAGWTQRRVGPAQCVVGVLWIWAILWPLYVIVPHPLLLGIVNFGMGCAGASLSVVLMSDLQSRTPDTLQGRAMSVTLLISWATMPAGSALSGFLVQALGPSSTIILLATCMVGIAAAATMSPQIRGASPPADASTG